MDISIKDLLKRSTNIKTKLISNNRISWLVQVSGEYKDMSKEDKGFSNKQLSQLSLLIKEVIHQEVPPIVVNIIHQEVPKIINEQVPPIVESIVEPLRNDINQIKNCPTIKKEMGL